jgi:hypothetical protein
MDLAVNCFLPCDNLYLGRLTPTTVQKNLHCAEGRMTCVESLFYPEDIGVTTHQAYYIPEESNF